MTEILLRTPVKNKKTIKYRTVKWNRSLILMIWTLVMQDLNFNKFSR